MISQALFGGQVTNEAIDEIAKLVERVEIELSKQVASTIATVEGVGRLTLDAGGKRLRPALTIASALATGLPVDHDRLVKIGTCLELIHMATLIHDDVIDESRTRRGKPTSYSVYGNTSAILSGDVLLARAMRLLALDGDIRIIQAVSEAVVDLAEGEVRELEVRGDFEISKEQYLEVVDKKTASLISVCCRVGAMVADSPATVESALANFGHHLGIVFQFVDDLLDYAGDPTKTGKPVGTDFKEGQGTLPLILLRAKLGDQDQSSVQKCFGTAVTDSELNFVITLMNESGSIEATRYESKSEALKCDHYLENLRSSDYKDILLSISSMIVNREN